MGGPRTVLMRLKLGFTHCVQALLYGYDHLPFTLWVLAIVLFCVSPRTYAFSVLLRVGRWRRLRISVARRSSLTVCVCLSVQVLIAVTRLFVFVSLSPSLAVVVDVVLFHSILLDLDAGDL